MANLGGREDSLVGLQRLIYPHCWKVQCEREMNIAFKHCASLVFFGISVLYYSRSTDGLYVLFQHKPYSFVIFLTSLENC